MVKKGKISKQIDSIKVDAVKEKLESHITEWIMDDKYNYGVMTKANIEFILTDNEKTYEKAKEIFRFIATYYGILMDAYTLGRMFRSFKQIDGKYSGDPQNIIVYAGGFHNGRYEKFLKDKLGFKTIYDTGDPYLLSNPKPTCVDVADLMIKNNQYKEYFKTLDSAVW